MGWFTRSSFLVKGASMRVLKFFLVGLVLTVLYSLGTVLYFNTGNNLLEYAVEFYNKYWIFVAVFECLLGYFIALVVSPVILQEFDRPIRFEGRTAKWIIAIAIITVIVIISYFSVHKNNEFLAMIVYDMFAFLYLTVVSYFFVFLLEEKY